MFNQLKKYNYITVVPMQNSFFHTAVLPKNIKLSNEIVNINYLKYSPYKNPTVITLSKNNKVSLWFCKHKINTYIAIPESYLVYKWLKNKNKNAIYIIDDDIIKIIIIKNSQLQGVFTLSDIDEKTIKLTMDEHSIDKQVHISKEEYHLLLNSAKNQLTYMEILSFSQIELDKKKILKKFIDITFYPASALILFAMLISYTQENIIKSEIEDLQIVYQKEKNNNIEIKTYIKKHNDEVKKFKKFINNELNFIDPATLMNSIYDIFQMNDNAILQHISIHGKNIILQINTNENPIKYLNKLNEIQYFSQVIIKNTRKPKKGMKSVTFEIEVKLLQNV